MLGQEDGVPALFLDLPVDLRVFCLFGSFMGMLMFTLTLLFCHPRSSVYTPVLLATSDLAIFFSSVSTTALVYVLFWEGWVVFSSISSMVTSPKEHQNGHLVRGCYEHERFVLFRFVEQDVFSSSLLWFGSQVSCRWLCSVV